MVWGLGKKTDVPAAAAPAASAPAAPPPVNPLVAQFTQAASLMQSGHFAAALPLFEALAKKPDDLVAAKVSRTAVAFFIAVNHIELGDKHSQEALIVVEKVAADTRPELQKMRLHALQMLSALYVDQAFRLRGSGDAAAQGKAQTSLDKGKAYAETAMAIGADNPNAKLAAAYVAVYEGRAGDAATLMNEAPKPKAGRAKRVYETVMEDVSSYLLLGDEPLGAFDVSGDSSIADAIVFQEPEHGPKKPAPGADGGGTKIFDKGPQQGGDDLLGGPGGAGARVPRPVKPGSPGAGAQPPIPLEQTGAGNAGGKGKGSTYDLA